MAVDMKDVIAEKLAEISAVKNVDKITVTELVDACGISRQAFYYHFRDIMDVIVWLSEKTIQETLEKSIAAESLEEAVGILVSFFADYRELHRKRLDSAFGHQFQSIISGDVKKFLKGIAKRSDKALSYSDFDTVLDFYAGGVASMLLSYAGKSEDTDQWLTQQLSRLISGELSLL